MSEPPKRPRPRLDLSFLDNPRSMMGASPENQERESNQINTVLAISLENIVEDPNQPRTEFNVESLENLAEDIRKRGVQQPITVRPKDAATGKYMILMGARRFRASLIAGIPSIPAIVSDKPTDEFAQVIENTKRENLSALDIANFIAGQKAAGRRGTEIAEELGETPPFVTWHLALLGAPQPLGDAFRDGRIVGVQVFYTLRNLHETHPVVVEELISSGDEITSRRVRELKKQLKEPLAPPATKPDTEPGTVKPMRDKGHSVEPGTEPGTVARDEPSKTPDFENNKPDTEPGTVKPMRDKGHSVEPGTEPGTVSESKPTQRDRISLPSLVGTVSGKTVVLLLNLKPSIEGRIFVRFSDGEEAEVPADEIVLKALLENDGEPS